MAHPSSLSGPPLNGGKTPPLPKHFRETSHFWQSSRQRASQGTGRRGDEQSSGFQPLNVCPRRRWTQFLERLSDRSRLLDRHASVVIMTQWPVSSFPPRHCPICGEQLWYDDRPWMSTVWQRYTDHVHTSHLEFERWNRRMSWSYAFPPLLFAAVSLVAVQLPSTMLEGTVVLLGLALSLTLWVTIMRMKERGKRRFRELWNQEHGRRPTQWMWHWKGKFVVNLLANLT